MAKVPITWELGGGLGHLVPLRSFVKQLTARGHCVALAVRDLVTAGTVFRDIPVRFFQAPHRIEPFKPAFDPPIAYGHILHNIGFGSADGLYALAAAWQAIFSTVSPDVILFEHSPTAMFAARSMPIRSAMIGTGFTVPTTPLPLIRRWLDTPQANWAQDVANTVEIANSVASQLQMPPLSSLDDIYLHSDEAFLLTYPELDHFGPREGARYLGIELDSQGGKPKWPYGDGPKIFAYLKPFSGFKEAVLQIYKSRLPSIVFCPGLKRQELQELEVAFPSIAFVTSPMNMELIARDCAVVICHGSHGMISRSLLAGIPVIAIPLQLEQSLLSHRLTASGAGIHLQLSGMPQLGAAMSYILAHKNFSMAARQFASKQINWPNGGNCQSIMNWVEVC